mgnify:CR=1 FL=1
MKASLISVAVAAAIVAWAPISLAREAVALPGVVGAEGELNGVDTTGGATLTITDGQNINTNNDLGGAFTTDSDNTGDLLFLGDSTVTGSTGQPGVLFSLAKKPGVNTLALIERVAAQRQGVVRDAALANCRVCDASSIHQRSHRHGGRKQRLPPYGAAP